MTGELCELYIRLGTIEHMRGRLTEAHSYLDLANQNLTEQSSIRYGHLQHQLGLL
jgi:hypothetical protein